MDNHPTLVVRTHVGIRLKMVSWVGYLVSAFWVEIFGWGCLRCNVWAEILGGSDLRAEILMVGAGWYHMPK